MDQQGRNPEGFVARIDRRTFLKTLVGVAEMSVAGSLLAACSSPAPTTAPAAAPTSAPAAGPTSAPAAVPTSAPAAVAPTAAPTSAPAAVPTSVPTAAPTAAPAPTMAPAAASSGKTLVFVANDTNYSNDPAQNWDYGGGSTILSHTYEGLFKFTGSDGANLQPNLAAEIPSLDNGGISSDGKVYTIKLKPNAKFHDGSPVNAEAVKFSYDRTKKLKLGVDFLLAQVDQTEAVDELTVRFHLKQPFSPFLLSIGSLWGNSIVSPTTVNANSKDETDFGQAYLQFHDAGSGGYILESYDPDQKQAILARDPNWWQGWSHNPSPIDRVVIRWITEAATMRSMLETGDAHIVAGLTAEDYEALSATPGIVTAEFPATLQSGIWLTVKQKPFDDVKVRQAFAHAFNYEQAIDGILGGHGVKLDSVVAKPYIDYAPASKQYDFNLDKAKALLEEAGYGGGLQTELYDIQVFPNSGLLLEMFQADLKKIGVELAVKQMDANAFLSKQTSGDPAQGFPGYISNIGGDYPDSYEVVALVYAKASQPPAFCCNTGYYENPKMDQIITRIEAALDPTERKAALQEAYDLAFEEASVIWIHNFKQITGRRDSVQGWEYNFMYGWNYAPFEKMSLA